MGKDAPDKDSKGHIQDPLDELVKKLDQAPGSSADWGSKIHSKPKKWEALIKKISEKQRELKRLVEAKKAGDIGQSEFEKRYSVLQDELTQLEFEVYNMRLGTNIEV